MQIMIGASAAQRPLHHNQISCAQHHRLKLHHNADTVFEPSLLETVIDLAIITVVPDVRRIRGGSLICI